MVFGKGFGGFDAQPMQIQIFCVLAAFEKALSFCAGSWANGDEGDSEYVHFAGRLRREEIGDRESAALSLTREGEAQELRQTLCPTGAAGTSFLRFWRLKDNYVVAITLSGEVSVHHRGRKKSRFEDFIFELTQNRTELLIHQPEVIGLRSGLQ